VNLGGGEVGLLFGIFVFGAVFLVITIFAAIRAGQNSDMGWLAGIILGWVVGLGWLIGLIYLVSVDPQRRSAVGRPPDDFLGRMRGMPPASPSATAPSGWYPDPASKHERRYWDGARWTEHVTDQGRPGTDPV
jgi:hypothetical protein